MKEYQRDELVCVDTFWVIENSWGLAKNDGENSGEDREKRI